MKWEQDNEKLKKVLTENKEIVEDDIGDIYWFLALLANETNIDIDEAINKVIEKNKIRFPIEKLKSKHTNIFLGGEDGQYKK